MYSNLLKAGIVSSLLLGLIGCSSGGSSGGAIFSASTSGVAAKGIIKHAIVTAHELNAAGSSVRTVGTGETDAFGKYTLTIGSSYTGGPLKLVLTTKSDGTTKMVCDVAAGCGAGVAFGADYTLSSTFALTAYQQAVSNGAAVKTQITPYTNMAAARVQAQITAGSTLDNTLVANANSEVSQIVGVDIANTEPVDITSASALAAASPEAMQYGAFNAGIGNVAFANATSFEAGIAAVASSFADGKFDASDSVSIASIVAGVNTEAAATSALNTTTLTATLASITTNTSGTGDYDPAPATTATLTAVAQARGLVSQTRTWGTQIAALQTPADAFGLDINTAQAVLNSTSSSLAGVFGEVLGGAMNKVNTQAASTGGLTATTYSYPINYFTSAGQVSGAGSVTVVNNSGSLKLNIASSVGGATTSAAVTTNIPNTILGQSSPVLDLAGLTINVTGSSSMSSPAASFTLTNAAVSIALKTGKTSATATPVDIASIGFDGALSLAASGVTFTGTGVIKAVANNNLAGYVAPFSLSELSVSGTFTGSKGSANATASVKFNNAATFDTIGFMNHQPVMWANQWQPNDPFGLAAAYAAATLAATGTADTLVWGYYDPYSNQSCGFGVNIPSGVCVPGDQGVISQVTAALSANYTSPAPSGVQNVYVNYSNSSGTYYNAMLTFLDFESASNYANATITVSSNVSLTGNPAATLTVTANRTAYGTSTNSVVGDVTAILSFNGQNVKFTAANTAGAPTIGAGALTVTNPSGVKLVLNGTSGSPTGTVFVDTTQVGTVDSGSGTPLIHYNDGTFESLN